MFYLSPKSQDLFSLFDEMWRPREEYSGIGAVQFKQLNDEGQWGLELNVAGLKKEDLELFTEGDTLTIQTKEGTPVKFVRSFSFREDFDPEAVSAEYKDGLLRIALKRKASHEKRLVKIA